MNVRHCILNFYLSYFAPNIMNKALKIYEADSFCSRGRNGQWRSVDVPFQQPNEGFRPHLSSFKMWMRWCCLFVPILRRGNWGNSGGSVETGGWAALWVNQWTNCVLKCLTATIVDTEEMESQDMVVNSSKNYKKKIYGLYCSRQF